MTPAEALRFLVNDAPSLERAMAGAESLAAQFPHAKGAESALLVWWLLQAASFPLPQVPDPGQLQALLLIRGAAAVPPAQGAQAGDLIVYRGGELGIVAKSGLTLQGEQLVPADYVLAVEHTCTGPERLTLDQVAYFLRLPG